MAGKMICWMNGSKLSVGLWCTRICASMSYVFGWAQNGSIPPGFGIILTALYSLISLAITWNGTKPNNVGRSIKTLKFIHISCFSGYTHSPWSSQFFSIFFVALPALVVANILPRANSCMDPDKRLTCCDAVFPVRFYSYTRGWSTRTNVVLRMAQVVGKRQHSQGPPLMQRWNS